MARNNPPDRGTQPIPVTHYDEKKARMAWDAYAALCHAERDNPKLKDNQYWLLIRADASAEFQRAFEALK